MIDRQARDCLAEELRQFAVGRLWSEDFERACVQPAMRSAEQGLREIAWAVWALYDDFSNMRLVDRYWLARAHRRTIARWVMFLRSTTEYEWPLQRRWQVFAFVPLDLVTLGATARARLRKWRGAGEYSIWPYRRWSDYRAALRRPVYLRG